MPPQSFGKYIVTDLLGSGGMAEVYAGVHPDLGRKVAIKVILPQFATESTFEARFRREARVVASLRHPHIVQIYDFDVVDGRHFMVMEHLAGGTLKDHLRALGQQKSKMPLPEIAAFVDAMAGALDYAHARSAVHRDIKPPNILFTATQEPVLTDFGIAKLLEDSVRLTATGGVVGSPYYMSPEQANGAEVDARSDQYSLAVIIYEMATGRVPFHGGSAISIMTQHVNNSPPSPRALNATLSTSIEAVLLKGLAKRPADRFESTGDFAQAFRHALEDRRSGAIAHPPADENARTLISDASSSPADATRTSADDATEPYVPPLVLNDQSTQISNPETETVVVNPTPAPSEPRIEPSAPLPPPITASAPGQQPFEQSQPPAELDHAKPDEKPPIPDQQLPARNNRVDAPASPPKPATQNFNVGGIQAGIVNQGGEQNFSGELTFNLDFGDLKSAPPQQDAPGKRAERGEDQELAAILEALRRAFSGSARVNRFVQLVTQFHDQLETLPTERSQERKQVEKRVQALLLEMTEKTPDPDMVEIMGASLERAVQPLTVVDPGLPAMATRITSWVELMVQPE